MFNPVRSRFSLAVGALLVMTALPVAAGPSIEDSLALSMSKGIRDRMYWNLSVISTKTKTKSEQPRDMTPEIVRIEDLLAMREKLRVDLQVRTGVDAATAPRQINNPAGEATRIALGQNGNLDVYAQNLSDYYKVKAYGDGTGTSSSTVAWGIQEAIYLLDGAVSNDYGFDSGKGYLTTPKGILAKSGNPSSTVALSVGYYLNDAQNWAVEALVLGAPVRATIKGAGVNDMGAPNQLAGRDIINTKLLPPIVKFGYYFGDRTWVVRPYVGVGAMYSIFFDTKPTSYFNKYNGGKTSVSIENKLAAGPFVGLESGELSGWRVGLSIGRVKFSTEATLVTRGTMFRTGDPALQDYTQDDGTGKYQGVGGAIDAAEALVGQLNSRFNNAYALAPGAGASPGMMNEGFTTEMMRDLAAYLKAEKGGDGTLGTFVRKQRTTLDNTLFMLSVGKSF